MQFDNISRKPTTYLNDIFHIIREGIKIEAPKFKIGDKESIKNQALVDCFNIIGTQNPKNWIGAQKEHTRADAHREDIYFYLNDDLRTKIFYVEAKRLPKSGSTDDHEYVNGLSSNGKPSGGVERFVLGIHGEPCDMIHYGMIAYVENKTVNDWVLKINETIAKEYPSYDGSLKAISEAEFLSEHFYNCHIKSKFTINHFWLDLVDRINPKTN